MCDRALADIVEELLVPLPLALGLPVHPHQVIPRLLTVHHRDGQTHRGCSQISQRLLIGTGCAFRQLRQAGQGCCKVLLGLPALR